MKTSLTALGTTRVAFLPFTACLLPAGALPKQAALGRSANCILLQQVYQWTMDEQHVCCGNKVARRGQWASQLPYWTFFGRNTARV
jgi:hypothetical protein